MMLELMKEWLLSESPVWSDRPLSYYAHRLGEGGSIHFDMGIIDYSITHLSL